MQRFVFVAILPELQRDQMELVTTFCRPGRWNVRLLSTRCTRELEEALDYRARPGNMLDTISRSPLQIQPVLDAIVETARRLCNTIMLLREGEFLFGHSASQPIPGGRHREMQISRSWTASTASRCRPPRQEDWTGAPMAVRAGPLQTLLATLLREEVAISGTWTEVPAIFSEKRRWPCSQTFADQPRPWRIENAHRVRGSPDAHTPSCRNPSNIRPRRVKCYTNQPLAIRHPAVWNHRKRRSAYARQRTSS